MKIKEPIVIGYFIEDDCIVVVNPCSIPIEMMENTIKEHKGRPDKKLVTSVVSIIIPIANIKKKQGGKK